MKRWRILLLVIFSLLGYLHWGKDQHMFLFQAEADILRSIFRQPENYLHPFILLPLFGQVLLLVAFLRPKMANWIQLTGMLCLALIIFMILFIGIIDPSWKMILSASPFTIIFVWHILAMIKDRRVAKKTNG